MEKRTAGGYTSLTANPVIKKESERDRLRAHHTSVVTAKPLVDTWNGTFVQVHQTHRKNRRVNRVEEARKRQIEKDNQILVEKMTRTVLRAPSYHNVAQTKPPYPSSRHKEPAQHHTLNYINRKNERDRILHENLHMAKRLIGQKPTLSSDNWREHSSEHNRLRHSLSKYEEVPVETLEAAKVQIQQENEEKRRQQLQQHQQQRQQQQQQQQSPQRQMNAHNQHSGSRGQLNQQYKMRQFQSLRDEGAMSQQQQQQQPALLPPLHREPSQQQLDSKPERQESPTQDSKHEQQPQPEQPQQSEQPQSEQPQPEQPVEDSAPTNKPVSTESENADTHGDETASMNTTLASQQQPTESQAEPENMELAI